jgi:serine/threonine-protein kinase
MALVTGSRLGPYEITGQIGAGGMGEVYRARDTRLKRDIALKILPESFASDPDRLARFQREAEVLASLNHPNIAAIYGLEDSTDAKALVMELIEGETLADRISRGAIPLDEALPIARQIAEALEAAHEQKIIHRDLKPANIKVRPDGTVKVLDFGLAKLAESTAGGTSNAAALSMSPTVTSPALVSGVGVLLGTAAYMSPEQAKGLPADKRSDIWAFGCVLYEMLTGKRAFEGEDVADAIASILARDVNWSALPRLTQPAIASLVKGCLEKDRRKRIGDIAVALFLLQESSVTSDPPSQAVAMRRDPLWQRIPLVGVAAVVTGTAVAVVGTWMLTRSTSPRVTRLTVTPSAAASLSISGADRDLAITPDGSRLVYVGNNSAQLFVRPLDALEPTSLFTGAPRAPFISPDGQWVGFVDGGLGLRKVALSGGPAITVARLDGPSRGAVWSPDDMIVFATANATTGLQRVPAAGGVTEVLTRPDQAGGEVDHFWPELLPGGHAILFTIAASTRDPAASQIAVLDLETKAKKVLVRGGSHAHYAAGGYLVYTAENTLRAIAFDSSTLTTHGTPVAVAPGVLTTPSGGLDAALATDGTLAYVAGIWASAQVRTLVWVDREGHETPIPAPPRPYQFPRLSPDGSQVISWVGDQDNDLWRWDFNGLTLTRLTFAQQFDSYPVWTPDGRRVIFASERSGARNLFSQAADGTGPVERLTTSDHLQEPSAVSPDGKRAIFMEQSPNNGYDILQVELGGTHQVTGLVQSPFNETNGIVSPDGRWLAYDAGDSGKNEIYVRPYPDVNTGRWQISTGGGTRPLWSRNGHELFYTAAAGDIVAVSVGGGTSWSAAPPRMVVKAGYDTIAPGLLGRDYDVSSDGRRFLMLKRGAADHDPVAPQIVVVQHFDQELKRLVPTN